MIPTACVNGNPLGAGDGAREAKPSLPVPNYRNVLRRGGVLRDYVVGELPSRCRTGVHALASSSFVAPPHDPDPERLEAGEGDLRVSGRWPPVDPSRGLSTHAVREQPRPPQRTRGPSDMDSGAKQCLDPEVAAIVSPGNERGEGRGRRTCPSDYDPRMLRATTKRGDFAVAAGGFY